MTLAQRIFLVVSTVISGFFGLAAGYLVGLFVFGQMKVIPFIRVGGIEIRGNWPGLLLGLVLCVACTISTYKSGKKKALANSEKNESAEQEPCDPFLEDV